MEKTEYTQPSEQNNLKGYFEPFTWTPSVKKHQGLCVDFIAEVNDITRGVETILELLESSLNDRDDDIRPLLNKYHEGALMRFAITSTKMIADRANQILFDIDQKAYQESKK